MERDLLSLTTRELINLRVSLARVAQALGLEEHIPGAAGRTELAYEQLVACATEHERGWHTLCSRIIDTKESVHGRRGI